MHTQKKDEFLLSH